MSTNSISTDGVSQEVFASNGSPLGAVLQSLQSDLSTGNLSSAESAFQILQTVLQDSATGSGATLLSNAQFSSDLASLGSALSSGNVLGAQSAFATVLGSLKTSETLATFSEAAAGPPSTANTAPTTATPSDPTAPSLQKMAGDQSGLNVLG